MIFYTFIAFLPWVTPTWAADEEANPYAAPITQERVEPKIPARWELDSSFFDELAARLPADASDETVYTVTRNLLREKFEERNGIRLPDVPNAKPWSSEHHMETKGLDQVPSPAQMTTFHSQVNRAILEFAKPWVLVDYSRRQAEWSDQTYNQPVAQALETRVAMSKSLTNVLLRSSFLIPGVTTPGVLALLQLSIPSHELKLMGYSLIGFSLALQLAVRWWDKRNYRLLSDEFILRTDSPEAARQDRANFEASVYKKCGRALSRLYRWTRGVR